MEFSKPVQDVILERTSCRTYRPEPMETIHMNNMRDYCADPLPVPWGTTVRFQLTVASEEDSRSLKGLGTYGIIKDPAGFIIGAVGRGEGDLEDFGFAMEHLILHATDMGLGTCWLGGTFSRSGFARKIGVREDEVIPAVAAIGTRLEKKALRDRLSRGAAGSDRRMPWTDLFFMDGFSNPLQPGECGPYQPVLEMVRQAPSASNKQPWRIIKEKGKNTYHLYLQRTKSYGRTLKILALADLQRVDMGIAMCHFQLTAAETGLKGAWTRHAPALSLPDNTFSYTATWIGE